MAKAVTCDWRLLAHELFSEAERFIPGGVNSPVRSFKAVGGRPIFVKRANGSRVYSECGRGFIDYCLSWGAMVLGHAHHRVTEALLHAVKDGTSFGTVTTLETELAKVVVEAMPSVEQLRLTNSGTEAVMAAIRLARAYTNKNKILKFNGSYHGHADYLLAKTGSGQATLGIQESEGIPEDFVRHTISIPYNNLLEAEKAVERYGSDLAAIIVEPVAANTGVIVPHISFLQGLRELADRYKIVLIFDEVITGFRLSYGGAQGYFNIKPELTCLGKIIGGGLPVGAFGGRREIMELLAPKGGVYQAGTLSGNPIAVTAGIATLNTLKSERPYSLLEERTKKLCSGIREIAEKLGIDLRVNSIASIFSIFFTSSNVRSYEDAMTQNTYLFKRFYHGLLKRGIYFSPSGFEANFLSIAHSDEDIDKTLEAVGESLRDL